ncbi:hypothetical protein BH09VER1_BH09VER1_46630 [soil metagenome]
MKFPSILVFTALTCATLVATSRAEDPKPTPSPTASASPAAKPSASPAADSLLKNGDFETEADAWPVEWPKNKDATYENEDGNHFLRLKSPERGATVLLYKRIPIPVGTEALEMTWRQRVTDLHVGKQAWYDARIMIEFRNAADEKLPEAPSAPYVRSDTKTWVDGSKQFLVPKDAAFLVLMPALFQVETGTFDLDDFVLKPVDATPIREKAEADAAEKAKKIAANLAARQGKAAAALAADGSLIANGNFETANKSADFAEFWGHPKANTTWETEESNHFLRMVSTEPGSTVMLYRTFDIPAGTKAIELKWRQRVTGLKKGANPWNDARIMMEYQDAAGRKLTQKPSAPYTGGDTKGWVDKSTSFLVPEDAATVVMMPTLFQVNSGTFDLDDLTAKPIDPAPLYAKMKENEEVAKERFVPDETPNKEKWPKEIHVQGNRLVDPDGKDVWLQGVNAGGLETLPQDDQPIKSAVVAVDQWKANCIRLPVKGDFWFGKSPYQKDGGKAYRDKIDKIVTLVANRGAYVALDLHRFKAPNADDAAFWKDAAEHFKNNPAVIFDLFNEPTGVSWEIWKDGGFVAEKKPDGPDESAFLTPEEKAKNLGYQSVGMQALINAVRDTGAKNIVIVGGLDWAYDISGIVNGYAVEDKGGNGIMLSTHIYPWKTGWEEKVLPAAEKYPIFIGEVGADIHKMEFIPAERQEDPATWVPDMLGFIQKYHLNWTGWCFHPHATPIMISDWKYTPTPYWGEPAKEALAGKQFELKKMR